MHYTQELTSFIRSLKNWLLLLLLGTAFFFFCSVSTVDVGGREVFVPVLSKVPLASLVITHMAASIVPDGIPLIVTEPLAAFVAQVKVAFVLSLITTSPVAMWGIVHYLKPALYRKERIALYGVLLPTSLLFGLGNLFAYVYILPTTFSVLYAYAEPLQAAAFLTVSDFVGLSVALMIVCGILFVLPVAMVLFSRLGIIAPQVWLQKWRYAAAIFLILSAIITPDGSGVTMVLLAVPLSLLYGVGAVISVQSVHKKHTPDHVLRS